MITDNTEQTTDTETGRRQVARLFAHLENHFGPTGWWPADSPFEMAIGAILTQNTAWTNVEKAIAQLKAADCMSPQAMLDLPVETLEAYIRPSGFFRQKATRLHRFCRFLLDAYAGDMAEMAETPMEELRETLLALNGIGPETADDILLYACGKPVFVVDTYTRRIFSRHGLVPADIKYADLQNFFHRHLESDVARFREFHGLIVWTGKYFCRKTPKCEVCPLHPLLETGHPLLPD